MKSVWMLHHDHSSGDLYMAFSDLDAAMAMAAAILTQCIDDNVHDEPARALMLDLLARGRTEAAITTYQEYVENESISVLPIPLDPPGPEAAVVMRKGVT